MFPENIMVLSFPGWSHGDKKKIKKVFRQVCFTADLKKCESKGMILASADMSATGDPWWVKHETNNFFSTLTAPTHARASVSSDSVFKQAAANNLQTNIAWDLTVITLKYVCIACFTDKLLRFPHRWSNYLLVM